VFTNILEGTAASVLICTLNIEAAGLSERPVPTHKTAGCHNTKDHNLNVFQVFDLLFQNADVLLLIVRWLGSIDADDQQWLAGVAYQLCTSNLPRHVLSL
jgi:hypothetical protein